MSIPYAFIRIFNHQKAFMDSQGRMPKQQAEYLMQPNNMAGKFLGECLDSCRWGSQMSVLYEMGPREMIDFIQNWMKQNEGLFQHRWHERPIGELYERFELPFIRHLTCPTNENHSNTILDYAGRVRCAHRADKELKSGYIYQYPVFDKNVQMVRMVIDDTSPPEGPDDEYDEEGNVVCDWSEERAACQLEIDRYKAAKPIHLTDICYAIIREPNRVLPLETILKRLNTYPEYEMHYCNDGNCKRTDELNTDQKKKYRINKTCPGHLQDSKKLEFPFDGWDLAFYVMKWHEQSKNPPVFEQPVPLWQFARINTSEIRFMQPRVTIDFDEE